MAKRRVMGIEFFELLSFAIHRFSLDVAAQEGNFFLAPIICLLIYKATIFRSLAIFMLEKQLKNFSEHVIFPVSLDNEDLPPLSTEPNREVTWAVEVA